MTDWRFQIITRKKKVLNLQRVNTFQRSKRRVEADVRIEGDRLLTVEMIDISFN